MITSCPLPIDWLEFLEGDGDPQLKKHLELCVSCQELVRRLEPTMGRSLTIRPDLHVQPSFVPDDRAVIKPGDIWLSAGSFEGHNYRYGGVDQLLFLVLRSIDDRAGRWFDVVPVFTDTDNAIPTDFNLVETETTLSWPLRLDLALQTTLQGRQLDAHLGSLTDSGQVTVRGVVQGEVDPSRAGALLEGEDDSRLLARRHYAEIVRTLGAPRTRVVEEAEDAETLVLAPRVVWFQVVSSRTVGRPGALAAADKAAHRRYEVVPTAPVPGAQLAGWELRYDPLTDSISLALQTAVGLTRPVRAVLYAADHRAKTSPAFIPEGGRNFQLASGWNVLPQEITRIELRLE